MMFNPTDAYIHSRMLDAAILVLRCEKKLYGFRLKVRWVLKRGLDLGVNDVIMVTNDEVKNWRKIELPTLCK